MFLMPLMISEAFSMFVIAAQTAALDPLMVTCASGNGQLRVPNSI